MASKEKPDVDTGEIYEKFNFRLNLSNPKERLIWNFLQDQVNHRDASRTIKQLLYESLTGLSWATNQPLQPVRQIATPHSPAASEPQALYNEEDLDNLDTGLGDWWTQAN
jgi:hypothetical protein